MVDCADNLHTGAEMLLQLHVYILAEAFKKHRISGSSDDPRSMFNEGQETLDEQNLRERKASLLQLFKAIDLNPRRPNVFLRDSHSSIDLSDKAGRADQAANSDKKKKKAGLGAVEEGEDPEEDDDAEVLSDGQLDMIYKKLGFAFRSVF
jgi:DNA repair protein RAD5